MPNDNWMDETVPSPRVESEEYGQAGDSAVSPYIWGLGLVAALLALTVCGLWSLYLLRGQLAISGGPTPIPIVWTPTVTPSLTPLPTATEEPIPTTSPDIAIGRYVQVAGTGGYGLSLRDGPGESYTRMDVAQEGEIFIVVEGPTISTGSEWWRVRDPENEERVWWAVGNFLEPVEHP